jgi:peptidoglycan/LPS O-acetylase OafA/YrhL
MFEKNNKIYFQKLDALRFFSALAVVITHVELIKGAFGYPNLWNNPFIQQLGPLGVIFFFVLSGFLITYLLLEEEEKFGKISVGAFYVRRILRIWPLYYLIVILGFYVLPNFDEIKIKYLEQSFQENFYSMLVHYLLILPNLSLTFYGHVPHIGHLWSIGVEEQFYILWPWILSRGKNKLKVIIFFMISILFLKGIYYIIFKTNFYPPINVLKDFVASFKIECMSMGAWGAYMFKYRKDILEKHIKVSGLWSSVMLVLFLIYIMPDWIMDASHLIYSFLFLYIILFSVIKNKKYILLDNQRLIGFGRISYGIYMYHLMLIPMIIYLLSPLELSGNMIVFNFLLYLFVLVITFLISFLSYTYYERIFLKMKSRFSRVISGRI